MVNACGDRYFYEARGMDEAVRMYYSEKTPSTSDAVGVFVEGNERVGRIP